MKITFAKVLGAVAVLGVGYVAYMALSKPKTTTSVPAGENTQYSIAQSQAGQQVNMKVGDLLQAPGQTAGPTVGGASVLGGNEASLANGGTVAASSTGSEMLSWPDGTQVTVTVS